SLNEQDLAADRQVKGHSNWFGERGGRADRLTVGSHLPGMLLRLFEPLGPTARETLVVDEDDFAVRLDHDIKPSPKRTVAYPLQNRRLTAQGRSWPIARDELTEAIAHRDDVARIEP